MNNDPITLYGYRNIQFYKSDYEDDPRRDGITHSSSIYMLWRRHLFVIIVI